MKGTTTILSRASTIRPAPASHQDLKVSDPVRVLHVYKSWTPAGYGGVEQVMTALSDGGRDYGIESRVLYLAGGPRIKRVRHEGIAAYCFPLTATVASTGLSLSMLWHYRRLVHWADVLHFHFPWPFGDLVHLLSGVKKPVVVSYHLDVTRQRILKLLYAPIMHRFLRQAAVIVATSDNYVRTSPVLQKLTHKVRVIPLGVEDTGSRHTVPIRMAHWRDRVGEGFVLFVGVLRYYKGLHVLLDAAHTIKGRVVIVGSGPCEQALKAHARRAGLSHVTFLGAVDPVDKDALYRLCGLFVFPSHLRSEGFGLALVEAAMHGKALVSCEIGTGTSFINVHQETGLVVEPGNPAALSAAVNRLLADRQEREAFGRRARQRYLERFTAQSMTEAYAQTYRSLVQEEVRCRR